MRKRTLIHGDNVVVARLHLDTVLPKGAIRVGAKEIGSETLAQLLTQPLFGQVQALLLDQCIAGRKLTFVEQVLGAYSGAVYVLEADLVTPQLIKKLGFTEVKTFKAPRRVYQWLDSVRPGAFAGIVNQYHDLLDAGEPQELLWRLLLDRIRLLAIDNPHTQSGLADWQQKKIQAQMVRFNRQKLQKVYLRGIEAEYAHKTGSAPFSLPQHTELLLSAIDRS